MIASTLGLGASALLMYLSRVEAGPILAPQAQSLQPRSPIVKRSSTLVGCDPTQTLKIGQSLADMANLALWGSQQASTSDLGFTHYFLNTELSLFQNAMDIIQTNNDPPSEAQFQFIVNCQPTGDVLASCMADQGSYAITDATVPANANDIKSMWICPLFWTGPDSAGNLPDTTNADDMTAFCSKPDYRQFVTAGHILLHEITHFDAVAKLFPLDPDDDGAHGTLDYSIGSSPIQDARRLKVRIDNGQNKLQAPTYTAESYAGAATELWAEKFCNLPFIPPKTGF